MVVTPTAKWPVPSVAAYRTGPSYPATGRRTLIKFSELDEDGASALRSWSFVNKGSGRKRLSLIVTDKALYLDVSPKGGVIIIR